MFGLLAAIAVAAVSPTPASAALSQCGSGRMCFWHNQDYGGTFFSRGSSDDHLGENSDEAHSLWNRTSVHWIVYDDSNFYGRAYCVVSGYRNSDLGEWPYEFGDKISSARPLAAGHNCPSGIPIM
jgi:hypothetical protein